MTGNRDPYRKDPEEREKHIAEVKEAIRRSKPTQWICWCGNIAEGNTYTNFDADGWSGVMVCSVCKRNMKRRVD